MRNVRTCEQCGDEFTPPREHARFCSAACRVAWNQEHTRDPEAATSALGWSFTAMREVIGRLARDESGYRARGFEVIGEAVWRVTLVDATLVRYHPQAYETALRTLNSAERRAIEATFGGLRFVRNQLGYHVDPVDFIRPARTGPGSGPGVTAWGWRSVPEPGLSSLRSAARTWELKRYRAYQGQLADHLIGETFGRASSFLELAAANRTAVPIRPARHPAPDSRHAQSS